MSIRHTCLKHLKSGDRFFFGWIDKKEYQRYLDLHSGDCLFLHHHDDRHEYTVTINGRPTSSIISNSRVTQICKPPV